MCVCRRLKLSGLARVLAFAMLWTIFEYLRGHILTGFPWNLIGYSWTAFLPVLQSVAVIGIYGLGLLTVAVASLPALLPDPSKSVMRARASVAFGLVLVGLIGLSGWVRLSQADSTPVPGVMLRVVQPDISADTEMGARRTGTEFRTSAGIDGVAGRTPAPPRLPM